MLVELSEGSGELVEIITQGMQIEILIDLQDNVRELQQTFGQFQLLRVLQFDWCSFGCGKQVIGGHTSFSSYRPAEEM